LRPAQSLSFLNWPRGKKVAHHCSKPTFLFLGGAIQHLVYELLDFASIEDLICIHLENSLNEIFMSIRKLEDFKARMFLDENQYKLISIGSPFIHKKICNSDHVVDTNID
jgi:hypothetical protein